MLRWTIVLVLALTGRAVAAPMRVVDAKSSVELDAIARGRLRLWLGTHVEICQIDTKQPVLAGDLKVHLDVAPRRRTKVSVVAANGMSKPVAACLTRGLRGVGFGDLAPSLVWDATLRLDPDGPSIEVAVESLDSKLDATVVRSAVVSALEQPADCMTRFFTATPVLSAVVVAKLAAHAARVTASTADSDAIAACVTSLLDPVVWPADQMTGAQLRISLLRPTTATDGDVVQLRAKP